MQIMISGFRCKIDKNCTLLGYYTMNSGNFSPMHWDNILVQGSRIHFWGGFLTPEEETDRLSRNAGKKLQLLAA